MLRPGSERAWSAKPSPTAKRKETIASASWRRLRTPSLLLRLEDLGDVGAGAVEELADLVLDLGVAAAGAEQLVEEEEEARVVLDHVGQAGDEDVEDVVHSLGPSSGASRRATRISVSRRTTSTSSRSLVPK